MAVTYLQTGCFCRAAVVWLAFLGAGLTSAGTAAAQDPVVDRLDSINFHPGQTATVVVNGKQLAGAMSLWTPVGVLRPKEGQDLTKDQPVAMVGVIGSDTVPGIYPARMVTNHGCSEAAFMVMDDLMSVAITAESENRQLGQLVTLPCCIDGHVNPVLSRYFRISMTAGQTVNFEIFARRLGSDLDPVLRITGPDGHEAAYCDDMPGAEGDTQLQFTASVNGEYRFEVRDVRYSGGARHFFHLRLGRLPMVTAVSPRIAQSGHNVSMIGTEGQILGEAIPWQVAESPGSLIPVKYRPAETDGSALNSVILTQQVTQAESEPNNARTEATIVPAETQVLTGTLQASGDTDWFKLTATQASPLLVTARTR